MHAMLSLVVLPGVCLAPGQEPPEYDSDFMYCENDIPRHGTTSPTSRRGSGAGDFG
jgi:hypothetical protein